MLVSASKNAKGDDMVAPKTDSGSKVVDIFADSNLPEGKKTKLNPEDDAWARSSPPPMAQYSLKLFPGTDTVKANYDRKDATKFDSYSINIEARIVDNAEYENIVVFATVSTRIGRGKEISTAAGLLVKLGYSKTVNQELNDRQVAQLVVKALTKEPVITGNTLDWKASYQDANGKWQNVFNTMTDFPANPEGGYEHIANITNSAGGRTEVQAKLFVKEWGGKGSQTVATAAPTIVVEEEKPAPAPVKSKANGKATPAPKLAPEPEPEIEEEESIEDEELLLEV